MSETARFFTDGELYERLMGRWSRRVGDQFLEWLAPEKGMRWLDVGCGNGAFTEALIARAAPAEIVGVDPSEDQLAFARKRPGAKGAAFQISDAESLPFPDRRFDGVTMALVVSFLSDHDWVVSVQAAHVVGNQLKTRYAARPAQTTFGWYRAAVLSKLTAISLYDTLARHGETAFTTTIAKAESTIDLAAI